MPFPHICGQEATPTAYHNYYRFNFHFLLHANCGVFVCPQSCVEHARQPRSERDLIGDASVGDCASSWCTMSDPEDVALRVGGAATAGEVAPRKRPRAEVTLTERAGGEKNPGGATARVTTGDVRRSSRGGSGPLSLVGGERKSRGMESCATYMTLLCMGWDARQRLPHVLSTRAVYMSATLR